MKFVKVGICGTHCAGKTTLVRDLKKALPKFQCFIEDTACMFPREDRVHIETQKLIAWNQMKLELNFWNRKHVISDRTVIDNLVYSMLCDTRYDIQTDTVKEIYDMVEDHIKEYPYSVIFFVDEFFPLEDNGNRSMDESYQRDMYFFMKAIIRYMSYKHGIPVVYIKGDRESRISQVKKTLEGIM